MISRGSLLLFALLLCCGGDARGSSVKVPLPQCMRTCLAGWSEFGSRCFKFVHTVTTWAGAERNCVSMGGHLASIHSESEFFFIQNLIHRLTNGAPYPWIGGTDAAQEGLWIWSDGSRFDYTHWRSGQPDNYGNEDCTHITGETFNDISCGSWYPSVCSMG